MAGKNKKGLIERPRTTCAQGGALATIGSLPDVVAISHAAEGCGGNLSGAISLNSGNNGEGFCSGNQIPTSAIREKNVIFGGSDRLRHEISSAEELIDAKLFVVITGCMTEIIGDDIEAVVDEFADAETPVVAVNTPSFEGDAYTGYELVLDGVFNKYLPVSEEKDPKLVNLFGVIPNFDPFYRGDLEEIARILRKTGLKVNTFFTPDQTFENILSAPKASLNIVLSPVWGVGFVKKFESRHSTPYWITDIPIGAVATERFLSSLAEHIDIEKKVIDNVIKEESDSYYGYFLRTLDIIVNSQFFYYAATVTNSSYAAPIASYLKHELGWQTDDVYVTDILDKKSIERLQEDFDKADTGAELIFETNTKQIAWSLRKRHPRNQGERYFDQHSPFYLIGSALEKYAAADLGALTLAVSYPVYNRIIADRGYAGYKGGLRLLEDLISVAVSGK